jgi:hypothetical protein
MEFVLKFDASSLSAGKHSSSLPVSSGSGTQLLQMQHKECSYKYKVFFCQWLEDDFISYLDSWEKSVKERSGKKDQSLWSPAHTLAFRIEFRTQQVPKQQLSQQ